MEIVEEVIPPNFRALNKNVAELKLAEGFNILAVIRGAEVINPGNRTALQLGDKREAFAPA